ncbi:hypothetical protein VTJ49DRAFT_91 [Mycothermus thermophilus]|uniref:FHA domain-containing protein n=1 Tax=Humicola insolens TaxID=85995 RepID=A0ABR3VRX9_HUMIN
MFYQPSPASQGSGNLGVSPPTSTTPASSTPPSRSSRLRGLSQTTGTTTATTTWTSTSTPTAVPTTTPPAPATTVISPTNPWFSALRNSNSNSNSHSSNKGESSAAGSTSDANPPSSSARTNRFSNLVPTLTHPLGLSGSSTGGKTHTGQAAQPTTATPADARPSDIPAASLFGVSPAPPSRPDALGTAPSAGDMARARSATASDSASGPTPNMENLPSIRFSTFYDPRATRPSLKFAPISRTLPTGKEVIRVGRYSERDNQQNVPPNTPSAAPVGFKSKVVSRRHCEFWFEDGKWYIKDVKSSSGTFLNHIRLSPPGTESKPFPVNDGDIVQLGIDFKGGEEMIFRCVKMRLELNRGWQNKLNTFNMATHKRLRNMTTGAANGESSSSYSQDCSICLNSIAPCQCLFVAPCSHTWHYKCIRSLLTSPSYPIFMCPNCRATADLEAEVEDPEDWGQQFDPDELPAASQQQQQQQPSPGPADVNPDVPDRPSERRRSVEISRPVPQQQQQQQQPQQTEVPDVTMLIDPTSPNRRAGPGQYDGAGTLAATAAADPSISQHSISNPVPIPSAPASSAAVQGGGDARRGGVARTPSPTGGPTTLVSGMGHEGPITPRNDAGPWVFDGSGVRLSSEGPRPGAGGNGDGGGGFS